MNRPPVTNPPVRLKTHPPRVTACSTSIQTNMLQKQPGELIAALAHEVRNPLTNINLSVVLLEAVLNQEGPKRYLDIIRRSSIRINDLINELLRYRQADEVLAESHSAHDLLDEVLEMAQDRINLKNITVYKEYNITDQKIVLNKPEMIIAFTNIIINAIEAMSGKNGRLKIITSSIANKFIVQIEDNGCGISKKNIDNIFKPYFTDKRYGLGLGLATTYNILKSNQVEVNVRSIEGKGASFILLFDKDRSV